jgi:serine/threonine-protein kinase
MELLEGDDLGRHLSERGPLSAEEALALLEQIGHAVGEAHRLGIVHRDLKPENVFIAKTRAAGAATTVKVLDFGIAKIVAEVKTMGTAAVGSPAWMAPEQADAGSEITPATDVWALGLLTFWMLTGASYWRTTSQPNVSMHAFLKEILFDALPMAAKRARDVDAAERLPLGFDDWFDRAVHREPAARFRDADELVASFRALVHGTAAPSVPASHAQATSALPVASAPMSTRAFVASSGLDTLPAPPDVAEDPAPDPPAPRPTPKVDNAESATLTPVLDGKAKEPALGTLRGCSRPPGRRVRGARSHRERGGA